MTSPARTPGKLGARPAVFPAGLRDLTFYAAGHLPKAPASVAVPKVTFPMDANDQYGDCGPAALVHGFQAAAADTGETEAFPSADEIASFYLAYTGGQDTGVVLSDFLAYVKARGFLGHTVSAYAPVRVHDIPALQFTVDAYDFAYCGIQVTAQMQQDFADGKPWTLKSLRSEVEGGHCIPLVGYDSDYLYCVTWGAVQPIAYSAWPHMASEAWAVLTGEIAAAGTDGHGINLAALQADLGKLDVPAPAPAPEAPVPGLLSEVASLVRTVAASTDRDIAEVVAFLHAHGI